MADVFLSYASKDRPAAERVQKALTDAGFDVFWDQEIPSGADWDTWIRDRLTGAKLAVVLWTHASIKSPNVRHEAMIARDAGKLLPVMLEALEPEDFPMGLYLVQGLSLLDWRSDGSQGMERLKAQVASRLERPAPPPRARSRNTAGLVVAGVAAVLVLAAAGGGWWLANHPAPEIALPEAASPATPPADAAANLPPPPQAGDAGDFASRLVGRWRWKPDQACADGPHVTLEAGRLVFTTPDSRYVHAITGEDIMSLRTTVLEPASAAGEAYTLGVAFFASNQERSYNMIVENTTTNTIDVWSPCELGDTPGVAPMSGE